MTRIILLINLIVTNLILAQDCPNRLGDFEIGKTGFENLSELLPYHSFSSMYTIENQRDYDAYFVNQDELDDDFSGGMLVYNVKPDTENIYSLYNLKIANSNDSIKVVFIPNYSIESLTIKNVLLKFYNDKLYYIKASLNKAYTNIIIEKYRGKGKIIKENTSATTCKNIKLKKIKNRYLQLYFSSDLDKIRSIVTYDFKVNKFCKSEINDTIEIFEFDILLSHEKMTIKNLEELQKQIDEEKRIEKEKILNKF